MKKFLLIFIPVIVAAGAVWYLFFRSSAGIQPTSVVESPGINNPGVTTVLPPVSTTAGKVSASPGFIGGRARIAPGSTIDFKLVKAAIYDPNNNKELKSVFLDADGSYKFAVTAGEYVLDLAKGYGSSKNLPQRVYVGPNETLELNFQVGK
ncbi:MAG: hypothetical protein HY433_01975 [Candidatus Liptonbacteria bacterium]|nr:hypothetical protein [Candidatus Liptonbacteria bacterium]